MSAPQPFAAPPSPPSERGAWMLACAIAAIGVAVLVAALGGVFGRTSAALAPPPVLVAAATPAPASAASSGTATAAGVVEAPGAHVHAAIVARPSLAQQRIDARDFVGATQVHISRRWMEGFYPIYAVAQSTFGVNWLLLASIHRQESAFSTAPGMYHGLNFAGCCGGPMQFNVKNGGRTSHPPGTWSATPTSTASVPPATTT